MGQGAKVESFDELAGFRAALCKFAETATKALGGADGEMSRVQAWLETEQNTFWQGEIRKRTETVARAKEALRHKKLFKDSSGRYPSTVDEEKALALANRRLAEAEEKSHNVRKWTSQLRKEILLYQGSIQRFATAVQYEIPVAIAFLDKKLTTLNAYVSLSAPGGGVAPAQPSTAPTETPSSQADSMARPEPVEEPQAASDGALPPGETPKPPPSEH